MATNLSGSNTSYTGGYPVGSPWQDKNGVWHQPMSRTQGGTPSYSVTTSAPGSTGWKPTTPTGTGTTTTPQTGSGVGDPYKDSGTTGTTSATNLDSQKLAQDIVKNPADFLGDQMTMGPDAGGALITGAQTNAGTIDPSKYGMDPNALNQQATTVGSVATAAGTKPQAAQGYTPKTTQGAVASQDMNAAQGQVSQQAQVDPATGQIDIASIAAGQTPTGQALNDFASLDLDNVDARATTKGQLEILQADFTNPDGTPKIPNYAQGAARAVSRIAAFKGMTGTAATAAMATAMMEASIQVADSDAKFYQTVTLQNLTNEQASIIQKAGILANFELQNADNRLAAAIQNSQAFLAMDLKNLDNEQQARVINNQNRVQSILEDAKAINTSRLFKAQSQNEMDMFYDNLNAQIKTFNAAQTNNMAQFNTGEINSMKKFNSELSDSREKFYKNMQYNIDLSNAKWRQEVTLKNADMKFNAAAIDVKNMVDISTEALNQLWDRSDAMLDYIWKSSENDKDRKNALALGQLSADTQLKIGKMQQDAADSAGIGSIFGTVLGNITGSDKFMDWLF